jgi:hypothetical protein
MHFTIECMRVSLASRAVASKSCLACSHKSMRSPAADIFMQALTSMHSIEILLCELYVTQSIAIASHTSGRHVVQSNAALKVRT